MIKSLKFALTLAALAAFGLSGPVQAASHSRDAFIAEQDGNGDGRVPMDEFAASRAKAFARQDADKDGGLSRAEYVGDYKTRLEAQLAAMPADKREEERTRQLRQADVRFGVLDRDKSGKITPAEYAYSGRMMFSAHDTNKDGFVSKDDVVPAAAGR
jgi:Ca2+-binding EF-hand superfamily protein